MLRPRELPRAFILACRVAYHLIIGQRILYLVYDRSDRSAEGVKWGLKRIIQNKT